MASPVLQEKRGAVGLITLNRPQRMNGWTSALATALYDALELLDSDRAVRVIVVTGAGRAFCAGADLGGLDTLAKAKGSSQKQGVLNTQEKRTPLFPKTLNTPVICAINGACAGIGLSFALSCDIRFADSKAKITPAFAKRGLVAEYGISWTLPWSVGIGNAMRLMLASEVIDGAEACRLGLVQKVFEGDVLEGTLAFAQRMAAEVSPVSMATMKRQLWVHPTLTHEEATQQAVALMKASLLPTNPDFKEGVKSFLQRRKPNFPPLSSDNPVLKVRDMLIPKSSL